MNGTHDLLDASETQARANRSEHRRRGMLVGLLAGVLGWPVALAAAPKRRAKGTRNAPQTGESAAERERRLTRECRGRPNSGACEGYAP